MLPSLDTGCGAIDRPMPVVNRPLNPSGPNVMQPSESGRKSVFVCGL